MTDKNLCAARGGAGLRVIAAVIAVVAAAFAGGASAQPIPPLAEVPLAVATAHPELVSRRAALAKERDALHAQFDQHNRQCSSVEEGSAEDAACLANQKQLSAALDRHIAASEGFNASIRSDIVEPGDVLKDSLNNKQSPPSANGKGKKPKPKPSSAQVFNTESACQAQYERRDRACIHPDHTDAKCENAALKWKAGCEAQLPADGWGH